MEEKLTHIQYCAQEFFDNARMKRRQAAQLIAEADVLERCAKRVTGASQMDAMSRIPDVPMDIHESTKEN